MLLCILCVRFRILRDVMIVNLMPLQSGIVANYRYWLIENLGKWDKELFYEVLAKTRFQEQLFSALCLLQQNAVCGTITKKEGAYVLALLNSLSIFSFA